MLDFLPEKTSLDGSNLLRLGDKYLHGERVEPDFVKAFDYYKQAASMHMLESFSRIGDMYRTGKIGSSCDKETAEYWYNQEFANSEALAKEGNIAAALNLASMLINSRYKDEKRAFSIYLELAESGNTKAMERLGFCFNYGKGISKDYLEAERWYKKAFDNGNFHAAHRLHFLYEYCLHDNEKANDWFWKSINSNKPDSFFSLGLSYWSGMNGLNVDRNKARNYFSKGIKVSEEKLDYYSCGNQYWSWGESEARIGNYKQAVRLLKEAVFNGLHIAGDDLGDILIVGKGDVKKSVYEAIMYYERAAVDYYLACNHLGKIYYLGNDVPMDLDKAEKWFLRALDLFALDKEAKFYLDCISTQRKNLLAEKACKMDYFLGCSSWEDVRNHYKKLMQIYHPDTGSGCEEYAKEINRQFDEQKRKYNQ